MAYMMQVRGRLLENSETEKMFRPHLLRSSSSLDSSSSLSVLTPKRAMLLLESEGPWETFLTPLICVISCCFCCFFFSRVLDVGDGISTSFCLSTWVGIKKKMDFGQVEGKRLIQQFSEDVLYDGWDVRTQVRYIDAPVAG